nr:MAG TPA: Poxvirus P21 membrane protein [Caudoviricetes sp.]
MQKRDIQAVITLCLWMLTLSIAAAVSIFIIIVAAITAYRW